MNTTRDDSSWRRIAIGSFVTLLAVALAWNAAAFAVDSSGLEQRIDSWGMLFGSVLATVLYGGLPLFLSMIAAMVAGFAAPALARRCAWCAAVIAALCSAALLLAAGVLVSGPPAEAAFGGASLLLAPVLLAPGALCLRLARRKLG